MRRGKHQEAIEMALQLLALQRMKGKARDKVREQWNVMYDLICSNSGGLIPDVIAEQINEGPVKLFYISTSYRYPEPPEVHKCEVAKISAHGIHELSYVGEHEDGIKVNLNDEVVPGTWWYRLTVRRLDIDWKYDVILMSGGLSEDIYDWSEWPKSYGEAI